MRALSLTYLLALLAMGPVGCESDTQHVEINGQTFRLELALDTATRTRGLMGRPEVAADGGMLFVFPNAEPRTFWMANCLTDLDIVFLDGLGYVVSVHRMTAPKPWVPEDQLPRWTSAGAAQFAIELRPGTADKLGIVRGQKIDLPVAALKARAR